MSIHPGKLYVVATPIGHLGDFSPRGQAVLQQAAVIAAEDTRHSKGLLLHFGITTPMVSYHEHNEQARSEALLQRLLAGEDVALISDAGTPLISDPGFHLIRAARQQGIQIIPVPGACAAITALSAAGLATDRFCFEGFLPAKAKQRLSALQALMHETRTLIFYESPHRIMDTLQAMLTVFGDKRSVVLAKELTKSFETIRAGCLPELLAWLQEVSERQKGEFVILIAGAEKLAEQTISPENQRILEILLAELPVKQAAALAAQITNLGKNQLYELAISLKVL